MESSTLETQKIVKLKVAVVILNWNGKQHLKKYLPDVIRHSSQSGVKVYVADNGSTDDSLSFVYENFNQLEVIKLAENYGFAEGYNRALSQIDAEYYLLLNSDVAVTPNWLDPLLERMESDAMIAAVQPKILSDRDRTKFEHAGAAGGFIDKYAYPFCRGRIMDCIEEDKGQYNRASEVFWVSGACMLIRSEVYDDLNGLDDDFFAHMEEIDLCWRIKNRGFSLWYEPKSIVYHWGGATLDYENPRKLFLNFRNSLWTLYKNSQQKYLEWIIFKRLLIDSVAAAKFLVTFNFKNVKVIYNAHRAFFKSLPDTKEKRLVLNQKINVHNHSQIYKGSIVWAFFVKGFRKFGSLKFK